MIALRSLLICLIVLSAAAAYAQAGRTIRIGNWSGGPSFVGAPKQLENCAASATNAQGIAISYSVDRAYRWRLAFVNPEWTFSQGYSFNVLLRVGDKGAIRARAVVAAKHTLEIQTEDDLALFAALWSAGRIQVTAGGLRFEFELVSSSEVLSALLQCVMRQASPARKATQTAAMPFRVDPNTAEETREFLSEMLGFARIRDAQILPAVAGADRSIIAWRRDLVTGTLAVIDGTGIPKAADMTLRLFGQDVRQCRNDFFFAWSVLDVDQVEVARSLTICVAPEATRFSYYTTTSRSKGGYYLMTITAVGGGFGGVLQGQLEEAEARLRGPFVLTANKVGRAGARGSVEEPERRQQPEKPEKSEQPEAAPFARE